MRLINGNLVSFVFLLVAGSLPANDTLIQKQIGGDEYLLKSTKDISIQTENLTLDLFDDHYDVTVEYDFLNQGPKTSLEIGFPNFQYIKPSDPVPKGRELRNFRTFVDGTEVATEVVSAKIKLSDREEISFFQKKTVVFEEKAHSKVVNRYSSGYTNSAGNLMAEYLVGSAATWKSIGKIIVTTRIHSTDLFLQRLPGLVDLKAKQQPVESVEKFNTDSRTFVQIYSQPSIALNTQFKAVLGHTSSNWVYGLPWDYDFEISVYPINGFRMLTSEQLRHSRNLVYAWHGYKFKDSVLSDFFHKTAWYDGRLEKLKFENEKFNEKEKANLDLIAIVENERKKQ